MLRGPASFRASTTGKRPRMAVSLRWFTVLNSTLAAGPRLSNPQPDEKLKTPYKALHQVQTLTSSEEGEVPTSPTTRIDSGSHGAR